MSVFTTKKTTADKLADVLVDREGSGSWPAIVLVTIVLVVAGAMLFGFIDDKLSTRSHEKEKQEIVDTANAERASLLKQLELRDKDLEAQSREVEWARMREQHHIKERKRLEAENEELQKILNSRIPADLYR